MQTSTHLPTARAFINLRFYRGAQKKLSSLRAVSRLQGVGILPPKAPPTSQSPISTGTRRFMGAAAGSCFLGEPST